jgi:hypothetical protein
MSLVKAWRRELLGAYGVSLVVPGTLCVALALLALAGGFGRLGSLGQLFSGPRIPAGPSAARHATGHAATPHAVPVSGRAPGNAARAAGASRRVSAITAPGPGGARLPLDHHGAGSSGQGSGGASGGHGSGTSGVQPSPTPPTSAPPATAPPTPAPPPSHPPTAVDSVVAAGTAVTSQLPNPVGATATQTLQSIGSTVDQILPIPAPGSSASQGTQLP